MKQPTAYVEQYTFEKWSHVTNSYFKSGKDWFSENCEEAAQGFRKLGYKVKGFLPEELENLPLSKSTIVKGSIRSTRRAFDIVGVPQPKNIDLPKELRKYAGREIWETTLGEVRKSNKKIFIKPLNHQKAFNGREYRIHDPTISEYPNDYKVLAQEYISIRNEHRAYILEGKILGIYDYGSNWWRTNVDFNTKLKKEFVKTLLSAYKSQPVAFALDFGFVEKNDKYEPIIVEVNDGFSLGNYGLSKIKYAKMVEARWKEIISTRK